MNVFQVDKQVNAPVVYSKTIAFSCPNCEDERAIHVLNMRTDMPIDDSWRGPHPCGACDREMFWRIFMAGKTVIIEIAEEGSSLVDDVLGGIGEAVDGILGGG